MTSRQTTNEQEDHGIQIRTWRIIGRLERADGERTTRQKEFQKLLEVIL